MVARRAALHLCPNGVGVRGASGRWVPHLAPNKFTENAQAAVNVIYPLLVRCGSVNQVQGGFSLTEKTGVGNRLFQTTAAVGILTLLLTATLPMAAAQTTSDPVKFGIDAPSMNAQMSAGVKPDYATFWVGPWTLKSGWGGPGADLDAMRAAGVTPAIHFYYWGDDISQSCLENGCWSSLHNAQKNKAGWNQLADQLIAQLNQHMGGQPVLIFVETEFNKGDVQTYEPLDGYLTTMINRLNAGYPAAETVLALGNWNANAWSTWDRAAAASDMVGIQGMRGSTHETGSAYTNLYDVTLNGATRAHNQFGRPVILHDIALSSYPASSYDAMQASGWKAFFDGLPALRAAGVEGIIARAWFDDPYMNLANYYGEAERHWGFVDPRTNTAKASASVWLDGIKAERALGTPAPAPQLAPQPAPAPAPSSDLTRAAVNFATKTTGAASADKAATSGNAWLLWSNGHAEQRFDLAPGTYDLDVRARGTSLAGVWPTMVVSVDGKTVATSQPGSTYGNTHATVTVNGPATLRVAFTNDAASASEDRNLIFDQVVWTAKPAPTPAPAPAPAPAPTPSGQTRAITAFATKTAGAATSDKAASSGNAWLLWSNGHAEQRFDLPAGTYDLDVRARGTSLAGVWPTMVVSLDGKTVATAHPTGSYGNTHATVTLNGPTTLRLSFTNDAASASEDRNLILDQVVWTAKAAPAPAPAPQPAPEPTPASAAQTRAVTSFATKTTGAATSDKATSSGNAWLLWSNGHAEQRFDLPAGTYDLDVRARGTSLAGVWPTMVVSLDGKTIATSQPGSAYGNTHATVTVNGASTLRIAFTNDARSASEDRNLILDQVVWTAKASTPVSRDAVDFAVKTVGAATPDKAATSGDAWMLWSNGHAEGSFELAPGTYDLGVRARGTSLGGVWPTMVVSVDGKGVMTANPTASYGTAKATVTVTGTTTVRVAFTNDARSASEDRNLILDQIVWTPR